MGRAVCHGQSGGGLQGAGTPGGRPGPGQGFGHVDGSGTPIVDVNPQTDLGRSDVAFHRKSDNTERTILLVRKPESVEGGDECDTGRHAFSPGPFKFRRPLGVHRLRRLAETVQPQVVKFRSNVELGSCVRMANTLKRLAPFRVGHVSCHHDVDGGSQELSLLLEVRLGKQWSELRRTIQEYFVKSPAVSQRAKLARTSDGFILFSMSSCLGRVVTLTLRHVFS